MSDELNPCPFCGGEVQIEEYTNPFPYTDSNGKTFWREEPDGFVIECKNHKWAKKPMVAADVALYSWNISEEGRKALVEAWNTRCWFEAPERTCRNLGKEDFFACSECSAQLEAVNPTYGYENVQNGKVNYCPNCGARVEGD